MRLTSLFEKPDETRLLALAVQRAFLEELDFNLELTYRDGLILGELVMSNGQKFNDAYIFAGSSTIYIVDDTTMLKHHTLPEIMQANPSNYVGNVKLDPEWLAKFVRDLANF